MKSVKWKNWVNLFLGTFIFSVPWLADHGLPVRLDTLILWNFWVVGAVVFIASSKALVKTKPWEEWINIAAGLWLMFSSKNFVWEMEPVLTWSSLILGFLVSITSGFALWLVLKRRKQTQ